MVEFKEGQPITDYVFHGSKRIEALCMMLTWRELARVKQVLNREIAPLSGRVRDVAVGTTNSRWQVSVAACCSGVNGLVDSASLNLTTRDTETA